MSTTQQRAAVSFLAWAVSASGVLASCDLNSGQGEAVPFPGNQTVEPLRASSTHSPVEQLGKELFFDKRLSSPPGQSCADCHAPSVGWTGPVPGLNQHGAVYPGAVHQRFGNRKPPSSAYATQSPILHLEDGAFVGGSFWDGRATGLGLGSPAADQAQGPFLNPVEQNLPSPEALCELIATSSYATLFEQAWGIGALSCDPAAIVTTFELIALAIAAYEASAESDAFSSRYDAWVRGEAALTDQELEGLVLFEGKGRCAACHPAPLFTDFTYDNLGAPRNPDNPFYEMDRVLVDGKPINAQGKDWVDPGLGGFLADQDVIPEWTALAEQNWGKHKVPTLRNVDLRPGRGWTKAYLHNGVFKTLTDVVHFYNTRDVDPWPAPEVAANVNRDELGDLGLTRSEEEAIVAFLGTLSDGWGR